MPLYEYKCPNCGAKFEAIRKVSQASSCPCEKCGKEAGKVITAAAVHFKGTGWSTEKNFWYSDEEAKREFQDQHTYKDFDD